MPLHTIHIPEQEIKLAIDKLNKLRPDKISVKFIETFSRHLTKPLYLFMKNLIKLGFLEKSLIA